jgi:hypothetical protein
MTATVAELNAYAVMSVEGANVAELNAYAVLEQTGILHLSHTIGASRTYAVADLQVGDLLVGLIWQETSGVRTYGVTHNSGSVTWNKAVQKDQGTRAVAICWTTVTSADLISGVVTAVTNGGLTVVHNAMWIHARPPIGKTVFFGGAAGFDNNVAGAMYADVAGGFDVPTDSIIYTIGVTTANFSTATAHPDFTLIATNNTRYLAQYKEVGKTPYDGTRAEWVCDNTRFGPAAMLVMSVARDTVKEGINDTLRLGWLGDPGSGATAQDNTRFDRDGTITGATWAASSGLALARTGWQFVDASTYITRAGFTTGLESFAVGGWIRRTSTGAATQMLFYVGNSGANGYGVYVASDGLPHILLGGVIDVAGVGTALAVGTNYHVALTRVGGTLGLWVNGTLYASTTSVPLTPSTSMLAGQVFSGWMGDIIFTRRIWNATELAWLADSNNSLLAAAPAFKAAWARQANVIIGGNVA